MISPAHITFLDKRQSCLDPVLQTARLASVQTCVTQIGLRPGKSFSSSRARIVIRRCGFQPISSTNFLCIRRLPYKLTQAITLLTCIPEVSGSNLGHVSTILSFFLIFVCASRKIVLPSVPCGGHRLFLPQDKQLIKHQTT